MIPTLVSFLVVAPLINAICIHALHDVAAGERPRARAAILAGLESFAPIFFAVVLAGVGIALGLVLLIAARASTSPCAGTSCLRPS